MPIDLRPHSTEHPLPIGEAEYERLVQRSEGGWSRCHDETEWLAKLYYLRTGYREGRLTREAFEERETRLVLGWLRGRQ
jgi:hypothetical protein